MNLLSSSGQTANVNFPLRARRSCQRRAVSNLLATLSSPKIIGDTNVR